MSCELWEIVQLKYGLALLNVHDSACPEAFSGQFLVSLKRS